MLGDKTRRLKKDKVLKTKEIWNDDSNKLDGPNLLSSFYAIKQNQMSGFTCLALHFGSVWIV